MADISAGGLGPRNTKIRNVPIAVTPEGFWCCPSPAMLQKTLKSQNQLPKNPNSKSPPHSKTSSVQKSPTISSETRSNGETQNPNPNEPKITERPLQKHKISVGFGQLETSDFKMVLHGKDGIVVKMSVHRNILVENSTYFEEKLSGNCFEVLDCDDVEIYVETVGLMYCKDVKLRLVKQNVSRVLRILKVAESLGFHACIKSCLDYLEAVPWVEEEEEIVIQSLRNLQTDKNNNHNNNNTNNHIITPLLKRVSSNITSNQPNETLAQIIDLVLRSTEDRARREIKTVVLKLLKENNINSDGSKDLCMETLYNSCQVCLDSLLDLFRKASEPEFGNQPLEVRDPITRNIGFQADNLLWLLDILTFRNVSHDFVTIWTRQDELAQLHGKLPIVSRHLISCVTARIFVSIGKGEVLPSKETKQKLIYIWLEPLIDDYNWLQHACRSFDKKVVEEGIGRTILTLNLQDQEIILMKWMSRFLKSGDSCPNLQRAFEVWWRRTFVRPYFDENEGNNS